MAGMQQITFFSILIFLPIDPIDPIARNGEAMVWKLGNFHFSTIFNILKQRCSSFPFRPSNRSWTVPTFRVLNSTKDNVTTVAAASIPLLCWLKNVKNLTSLLAIISFELSTFLLPGQIPLAYLLLGLIPTPTSLFLKSERQSNMTLENQMIFPFIYVSLYFSPWSIAFLNTSARNQCFLKGE